MTAARLDRAQVLSFTDAAAPDTPVVLSLGGIARETLAVAGRKGNHFVSLDARGQTISVALGLENSDTTGRILAAPTPSTPASPSSKKGLRPAPDAKRNGVDGNERMHIGVTGDPIPPATGRGATVNRHVDRAA